ncbi:hypothetical protein HAX54_049500 [Datura stramonium]|uniref:F-box associated beta-propeller type 1 domain-containing protein n=1 Tax=Datura stramonium TaxID=4076 RepID=A0ABS8RR88_DATST|nr:hypothetical protein [Datura stramonium]
MAEDGKYRIEKFDGADFSWWKMQIEELLVQKELDMVLGDKPEKMPDAEWADSWTKIEIGLSYFITSIVTKAFLDGSAYWVARKVNETEYYDFIVSFNMVDHAFEEIKLPKCCLYDGELTGSLEVFRDSVYLFVHGLELIDQWHNGEVIFESIEEDLYLYDPTNQQFQDLHFLRDPDTIEPLPYKESLDLLDLGTKSWPKKIL